MKKKNNTNESNKKNEKEKEITDTEEKSLNNVHVNY